MPTRRRVLISLAAVSSMAGDDPVSAAATDNASATDPAQETTRIALPEEDRWPATTAHTRFVVINDLHLTASETRGLAAIITRLNVEKPDFLVFAGDLNKGQSPPAAEHESAMQSLMEITSRAEFPCRYGMGNTDMAPGDDATVVFRKWTGEQPYYRFEQHGVWFFMLYTEKTPPARFGFVDRQQMDWLTTQLTEIPKDSPIVLFGHHALFEATGKWEKDNWGIENSQELLQLLVNHRLVATFSGHRHLNRMARDQRDVLHVINGAMYGDHSDDLGPKQDGIGYRWVEIGQEGIQTRWVRVGYSHVRPG